MIKSMTGYGRGQAQVDGLSFSVEIKAVNHRYGDINIKAPRLLSPYEAEMKKRISGQLKRGKIDVYINQENTSELLSIPEINENVVKAYLNVIANLKSVSGLSGEVGLEFLASQKDVLTFREVEVDTEALKNCLYEAVDLALGALTMMREKEGEATADDMNRRLVALTATLESVEECAPRVPIEWQEKLKERLAKLQETECDPQRVAQEIAIFADRCDISEEVTRFRSHLQQFEKLMIAVEPVGRQMDFLVQELNREANTMGSKSNDAELTRLVVALKSELEKIREQVQNIE